jgi:hypothetical protein
MPDLPLLSMQRANRALESASIVAAATASMALIATPVLTGVSDLLLTRLLLIGIITTAAAVLTGACLVYNTDQINRDQSDVQNSSIQPEYSGRFFDNRFGNSDVVEPTVSITASRCST